MFYLSHIGCIAGNSRDAWSTPMNQPTIKFAHPDNARAQCFGRTIAGRGHFYGDDGYDNENVCKLVDAWECAQCWRPPLGVDNE